MDVAGEVSEDGEGDVDEEVRAAAGDAVDAYGRDWRTKEVSVFLEISQFGTEKVERRTEDCDDDEEDC